MTESAFAEKLKAVRKRLEAEGRIAPRPTVEAITPLPESFFIDGMIPGLEDLDISTPSSAAVDKVNEALDSIGIVEAYTRFCGKMTPKVHGKQRESIMISCPVPGHVDANPSAWLNLDKGKGGLWRCGVCDDGGDKFDLAAIHYGYGRSYKTDRNVDGSSTFWELKRRVARDLRGVDYDTLVSEFTPVVDPEDDDPVPVSSTPPVEPDPIERMVTPPPSAESAPVVAGEPVPADVALLSSGREIPTFDIDSILTGDSFLRRYWNEGIKDDSPNEYQLWCGLAALSVVIGRRVVMQDSRPVTGNLAICLTGPSTAGKSRALEHCTNLIMEVVPFDSSYPSSSVTYMKNPSSGEYLVKRHMWEIEDPTTPGKGSGTFAPIKSLVEFDEIATFAGRSSQAGNTLKQFIMDLADGRSRIETGSITNGTFVVQDAFSTLITTTQPASLKFIFNKSDAVSGLLNRFIFPAGHLKRKRALGAAALDFSLAKDALQTIKGWAGTTHVYTEWEPAALALWEKVYHDRILPLQTRDDTSLLGRLDLTMKRLILLFAANEMSDKITLGHVTSATNLLTYLLGCYAALDTELNTSSDTDFMTKVLARIKADCDKRGDGLGPTAADLRRYIKGYESEQWVRMMKNLEQLDLVQKVETKSTRGRARVSYHITDAGAKMLVDG